jgi:hypothetical protein
VSVNDGYVGRVTVTVAVTARKTSGVIDPLPIVAGLRWTFCTVGVPLGWVAENVADKVVDDEAIGAVPLPE